MYVTDRNGNQKQLAGTLTDGEANYRYDLICHENLTRSRRAFPETSAS